MKWIMALLFMLLRGGLCLNRSQFLRLPAADDDLSS
jgi:hypothetical protein